MITLVILNNVLHWVDSFYSSFMSWAISPITAIATYIQAFYVPQTFLDIFSIANYFLPIGTIAVLFGLTAIIILIKILAAVLHFLSLGILFKS